MDKTLVLFKINSLVHLQLVVGSIMTAIFTITPFPSLAEPECYEDESYNPTTGDCGYVFGSCAQGETRGESGFCAPMPESCPPGTAIDEDPICEPVQITEQPEQLQEVENIQWAQ